MMIGKRKVWSRIILLLPIIMIITLISFSIVYFSPGDASQLLLRERLQRQTISEEQARDYSEKMGLDDNFTVLYTKWLRSAIRGDFGKTLSTGEPVADVFWRKFKITLTIALLGVLIEVLLALPIGLYAGMKPNSIVNQIVDIWAVISSSIPSFWIALIALWYMTIKLKMHTVIGYTGIESLIIPALIIGLISCGNLLKIIRGKSLEISNAGFVEFAFAQGLGDIAVLRHHILPFVMPLVLSIVILDLSIFIGGAVIIESIFNIPGFSGALIKSISIKDYTYISGSLFFIATLISILNLIADLIYPQLDARNQSELLREGL